jgi:hypothetical protein
VTELFLSPLPLILAAVLFFVFSLPPIASKLWAKAGRASSVLLFVVSISMLINAVHEKGIVGERKARDALVTTFTKHVGQLLIEGRCDEASALVKNFNSEYQAVSPQLGELDAFVRQLTESTTPAGEGVERMIIEGTASAE